MLTLGEIELLAAAYRAGEARLVAHFTRTVIDSAPVTARRDFLVCDDADILANVIEVAA